MKNKFAISAVLAAVLGVAFLSIPQPVVAAGVGKIRRIIEQVLDDRGLTGDTLTLDEIALDVANADTFISRAGPGTIRIGATSGSSNGVIYARRVVDLDGISGFDLSDGTDPGLGLAPGREVSWASGVHAFNTKDTFIGRSSAGTVYVGATTSTADGTLSTGKLLLGDGLGGSDLAWSFASDPDTGVYRVASNRMGFVSGGTLVAEANTHGINIRDGFSVALGSNVPDAYISGDGATSGLVTIGTTSGGTDGTLSTGTVLVGDGTQAAPAYSAASDPDTGLWFSGSAMNFGAGNTRAGFVNASGTAFTLSTTNRDDTRSTFGTNLDVFDQGELTTLTDGTASTVLSVTSADGDMPGLTITYTIQMTDGTDAQSEQGTVQVAFVDLAGGVTASTPGEVSVQALSSGTLTTVWSVVTTDDQSIEIQCNATSSLTTTTSQVRWKATVSGDVTLTVP